MLPNTLNLAHFSFYLWNEEPVVLTGVGSSVGVLILDAENAAQKFPMKLDVSTFFVGMYEAAGKAMYFYKPRCPSNVVKLV